MIMEAVAEQPRTQEQRQSFDPLASIYMLRYDIGHFGYILPETRERVRDEQLSQLSEAVNRPARTSFLLKRNQAGLQYFNRGELAPYDEMLDTGLEVAQQEAERDPRKSFLVTWAQYNRYQGRRMATLRPGEHFDWFSCYPKEEEIKYGADFLQRECGLQPDREMGFLYRATCLKNGQIILESQTVDRSHKDAFKAAMEVSRSVPHASLDDLVTVYDATLEEKMPGEGPFHAGRTDSERNENIWQQITSNRTLIEYCLDEFEAIAQDFSLSEGELEERTKKHIYGVWAYFNKQIAKTPYRPGVTMYAESISESSEGIAYAVQQAFQEFAEEGRIFAACGGSIEVLKGEVNILNASSVEVFSAIFNSLDVSNLGARDKKGSRYFSCENGHLNYRRVANIPEKVCSTCNANVSCGEDE